MINGMPTLKNWTKGLKVKVETSCGTAKEIRNPPDFDVAYPSLERTANAVNSNEDIVKALHLSALKG